MIKGTVTMLTQDITNADLTVNTKIYQLKLNKILCS